MGPTRRSESLHAVCCVSNGLGTRPEWGQIGKADVELACAEVAK